jgi:AcrR family transcriptional regulator
MDPTSNRELNTRQAILRAAFSLFAEQGFHGTSMRQIAETSGTALGGIYNHFQSKKQIFEMLLLERHPVIQVLETLSRAPGGSAEEFFRSAAGVIQDELRNQPGFIKIMLIEITEFKSQHLPTIIETFLPKAQTLIERFRGEWDQMRDLPTREVITHFFSAILASNVAVYFSGGSVLPDLETHLDIFFHGIMNKEKL